MKAIIPLLLLLFVFLLSSSAGAGSASSEGVATAARRPHHPHQLHKEVSCSYEVTIKSSCFSPEWSRERIRIAFGDKDVNEVVVDVERSFERCGLERFEEVEGPCVRGPVCFVYVYHRRPIAGAADGWSPEWITIRDSAAAAIYSFDYSAAADYARSPIPTDIWIGFDECPLPPMPPKPHAFLLTRRPNAAVAAA